jgi:hypothetical protein
VIATVLDTGPQAAALNINDRRHFSVVKPAHIPALTLLP